MDRADEPIAALGRLPHPEGGHCRELFRSATRVVTARGERSALTTIDFLLGRGEFSAWHRVRSDEVWHLLEGGPLRLHLLTPDLSGTETVELGPARRRHVV